MSGSIRIGTAEWNPQTQVLERVGQPIHLTRLEKALLHYLGQRVGTVVPVGRLLEDVWGYAPTVRSRAVDNAVSRLRKKLGNDAAQIQTVYGQGFCLIPTHDRSIVGRDDELTELGQLAEEYGLVSIYGLGGVGKSALARAFAARWPVHVWVELHDPHDKTAFSCMLAEELGLSAKAVAQVPAQLASLGQALVVVDGAEHAGSWLIEAIVTWRRAAPLVHWVLTSRVLFGNEVGLELRPLGPTAAVDLLKLHADLPANTEPEKLGELVDLVDRLPLGIELAAARLRVLPAEELVAWLEDHGLEIIDGRDHRLSGTLTGCWSLLDAAERRCLSAGALMGSGFRAEPVGQVAQLSPVETLDALERLLRTGMVRRTGQVYTMLDLVRSFAADRAEADLRLSLMEWSVARAQEVRQALEEDWPHTRDELTELVPVLLRALEDARTPETRAHLLLGIRTHDEQYGPMGRTREWFEALPVDDLPLEVAVRVWAELGRLHTEADERDAGLRCHERACELAQELDNVDLRILTQCRLANMVRMVKGPTAAVPMARRTLAEAEARDTSLAAQAGALASLESSLTTLGEFEEAHRLVLRILARLDGRPDREVGHRARLGFILQMQGESERAVHELERVFEHALDAGLDRVAVSAGRQLGNLLSNLGRDERAEVVYGTLMSIAQRIGSPDGVFGARLGLASITARTDAARAIQLYEELRERTLLVGRVREASVASLNIGMLEHGRGRLCEAEAAYRECLTTIEPIGWRYVIALARCFLALLLDAEGRIDEARAELAEARPGAQQGQRIRDAVAAALDREPERVGEALAADVPKEIASAIRDMIALGEARRGPEACG